MLLVHHLRRSQSERIAWLCEELGLSYDLRVYDRDPTTGMAPAEYRRLHPAGTAPVLEDGETLLAESSAILEYLARRHGGGRLMVEPNDAKFADFLFWFHFTNASLMPSFVGPRLAGMVPNNPIAHFYADRLDRSLAMIEARLAKATYLAGEEFTVADINILFALTTMRGFVPLDFTARRETRDYTRRMQERPAYRAAFAKMGEETVA